MESVYLETSVISYLAARPSRDSQRTAHQELTRFWWNTRRREFLLFVSPLVLEEVARGDPEAAARRLTFLAEPSIVSAGRHVGPIVKSLIERHALPVKATDDALHVAYAAAGGVIYLLTWNCRHIANAEKALADRGYNQTTRLRAADDLYAGGIAWGHA